MNIWVLACILLLITLEIVMVFEDLTSSYALLHAHVLSSRDYDQNTLQKGCNKSLETATRAK